MNLRPPLPFAVVLAALCLSPLPASGEDGPDPDEVFITGIAYAGSGCPPGSVVDVLADDARSFLLLFDSFVASAGPDTSISENRKSCKISVGFRVPRGWSYALEGLGVEGHLQTDAGVEATLRALHYFGTEVAQRSWSMQGTGPEDRELQERLGGGEPLWSPCGAQRDLNIDLQIRVSNARARTGSGQIEVSRGVSLHPIWRRCP